MNGTVDQNLKLYQQLISCAQDLHFFTFDLQMNCIYTTAPDHPMLKTIFALDEAQAFALRELLDNGRPVVMTGSLDFLWIADGQMDPFGKLLYIHVIGPVFTEDISVRTLERSLTQAGIPTSLKSDFLELLQRIPIVPLTRFFEYGMMLHYCITEEKITVSDMQYPRYREKKRSGEAASLDAHGTWAMEQNMMRLISEGNPDFRRISGRMASAANLGNFGTGDPIRYLKNITIISTALCTRAAIQGGLDPEIAYSLSDRYIRSIEAESALSGIAEVNNTMQNDFVQRVHLQKISTGVSAQIQKCCGYIQLHAEEKISEKELARFCGYSETHLSRKFRQETGKTIKQYTMEQKMIRAKDLLCSENLSVQDVTEKLGFESQSYFGRKFKEFVGMTPGEYQAGHHRR